MGEGNDVVVLQYARSVHADLFAIHKCAVA